MGPVGEYRSVLTRSIPSSSFFLSFLGLRFPGGSRLRRSPGTGRMTKENNKKAHNNQRMTRILASDRTSSGIIGATITLRHGRCEVVNKGKRDVVVVAPDHRVIPRTGGFARGSARWTGKYCGEFQGSLVSPRPAQGGGRYSITLRDESVNSARLRCPATGTYYMYTEQRRAPSNPRPMPVLVDVCYWRIGSQSLDVAATQPPASRNEVVSEPMGNGHPTHPGTRRSHRVRSAGGRPTILPCI